MSTEARIRRRRRVVRIAVLLAALLVAAAAWAWAPWRRIEDLRVERATLLAAGTPDGSRKPASLATPVRIAVDFSVPAPLAETRDRLGIGFVAATLFACDVPDREAREVATQRTEYLGDYARVATLPTAGGRARYRAVFDDRLSWAGPNGALRSGGARAAGALCFRLAGGNMAYAPARSATIRLPALG